MTFLSFKQLESYRLDEGRAKMASSGVAAEDHLMKYVLPYLNAEGHTHTLATEHEDLPAGSHVKLKSFDENLMVLASRITPNIEIEEIQELIILVKEYYEYLHII